MAQSPPGVPLNRVTAAVGGIPITQHGVELEWRLEKLLQDGKAPRETPTESELAAARDRLIDQTVLEQALADYQINTKEADSEAAARIADLRKKFPDQSAFAAALRDAGVAEATLTARLKQQNEIMQMIDGQLRPAATVSPQEVQTYYEKTLVPSYSGKGPAPALKQAQSRIREILTQQKINQLLDQWLAQLKKEHPVSILAH